MTDLLDDPYLTIGQVADLFAVKPATVRRWIKAGRLKAYKPGRDWRIRRSDAATLAEKEYGNG